MEIRCWHSTFTDCSWGWRSVAGLDLKRIQSPHINELIDGQNPGNQLGWYVQGWFYSAHLSGDVAEFLSHGFWGTNSSCCSCANKGFSTNRNANDMLHEDVICTIYIICNVYSLNTNFPGTRTNSLDVQYVWLQSLLIWNVRRCVFSSLLLSVYGGLL